MALESCEGGELFDQITRVSKWHNSRALVHPLFQGQASLFIKCLFVCSLKYLAFLKYLALDNGLLGSVGSK